MSNFSHVLIHPDEDGNTVTFLTSDDLDRLLANSREEYGVENLIQLDQVHEQSGQYHVNPTTFNTDPQQWPSGTALLLRVESVKVKPVTTAWAVDW